MPLFALLFFFFFVVCVCERAGAGGVPETAAAMEARVRSLVDAARALGNRSTATGGEAARGGNPPDKPASASASASAASASGGGGGGGGGVASLLSFSLTPEEGLLEVTLRENLELRKKLALLEPPPQEGGTGEGGAGGGVGDDEEDPGGQGGQWAMSKLDKEVAWFLGRVKEKAAETAADVGRAWAAKPDSNPTAPAAAAPLPAKLAPSSRDGPP